MSITCAPNGQGQTVVICTDCLTDLRNESSEQIVLEMPLDELLHAVLKHVNTCRE